MEQYYIVKVFSPKQGRKAEGETVAAYRTIEDAIKCVKFNYCNFSNDGKYKYVCIGSVYFGIYQIVNELQWFQWDTEKEYYEECSKPFKDFYFMI